MTSGRPPAALPWTPLPPCLVVVGRRRPRHVVHAAGARPAGAARDLVVGVERAAPLAAHLERPTRRRRRSRGPLGQERPRLASASPVKARTPSNPWIAILGRDLGMDGPQAARPAVLDVPDLQAEALGVSEGQTVAVAGHLDAPALQAVIPERDGVGRGDPPDDGVDHAPVLHARGARRGTRRT